MQKNHFANQVIWITGASSGIGEALAYAFNREGAHLILSARDAKALEKVKYNCTRPDADVQILPLDLSEIASLKEKVEAALDFYDKVDYMIHNAGIALRDLAINTDMKVDQTILKVNYLGPVAITKFLLPKMIEKKSGEFVVISSLSGKYGVPKLSAYAASKQALHGFFDSLRSEVYQHNIKIKIIIPGIINTGITVNALTGDGKKYGKMEKLQEQGMTAQKCAKKILRAISKGKEETLIGGSEIITVYFRRFFPTLFSKIIRNHPIKKINRLKQTLLMKK